MGNGNGKDTRHKMIVEGTVAWRINKKLKKRWPLISATRESSPNGGYPVNSYGVTQRLLDILRGQLQLFREVHSSVGVTTAAGKASVRSGKTTQ